ncbi:MAG: Lrp/AsnC family transcriptional regulator [Candidatus Bathyarchaeia archaeon]
MTLDSYDLSILEVLQKDSRTSLTDVGKAVGLSRFAVRERIQRMFRDQMILGPTVVVNPPLVGIERTVFFELKTNPHEPWLAELLEGMSACDVLDGITGEYSLLGRFRIRNEEHLRQTLKRIDEVMSKSFFKKYRVISVINTFKESGVIFNKQVRTPNVDNIDLEILRILLNQPKYVKTPRPLSTTQLSRLLCNLGIQISQPAVFKRLARLESRGVILGHTIMVDHLKLGIRTKLMVRIKVNPASYDTVARDFLAPMKEITDLYRTGENYGLMAITRVSTVSKYNSFLLRLYTSEDVIDTYTILVLEERKKSPLPLGQVHRIPPS